jgi:hypothetical protein
MIFSPAIRDFSSFLIQKNARSLLLSLLSGTSIRMLAVRLVPLPMPRHAHSAAIN